MPKRRRIGIDMRPIEPGFRRHAGRGTGRYVRELGREISEFAKAQDIEVMKLGSSELSGKGLIAEFGKHLPLGRTTFQSQLVLPLNIASTPLDSIHFCFHGDSPAFGIDNSTISVLDLIPRRFPELYRRGLTGLRYGFARFLEKKIIENAKGIIAISEATKNDLVQILDINPKKIAVTPLAVSVDFLERVSKGAERAESRQKFSLPQEAKVLAYLGGIDPRKNVPFLLDLLADMSRVEGVEKPLLLLGGSYNNELEYPELKKKIASLNLSSQVIETGFVEEEDLLFFYRAADIFVFPSIYEGFGFPVLEAMAAGVPVVAGNNSSIPELSDKTLRGEKGVFLLEDNNLDLWGKELIRLLQSPDQLRLTGVAGQKRAKEFSWKRTAELTVEAWQEFDKTD